MYLRVGFFLLCVLIQLPYTAYAKLKLGEYTFAEAPAKALDINTPLYKGLESLHFVNQVGGVAFDGIARSLALHDYASVTLEYSASRKDGERLRILFKDKKNVEYHVMAEISDWQLFPIARFANSDASACATSQGELLDHPLQQRHMARGDWILNYHPAFENTLLGLRLVQADFLAVIPEACDLPQSYDDYLLGNGEKRPNVKSSRQKWNQFKEAAQKIEQAYTAYVICDYESPVTFSLKKDKLSLSGEPVWCFVHVNQQVTDSVETVLREEVMSRKKELHEKWAKKAGASGTDHKTHARIYQQLLQEYTDDYLDKRRADLIDALPYGKRLQRLHFFSSQMTGLIRRYRDMNAPVYDALVTTMRYAAFFRWLKGVSPTSLQELIDASPYAEPLRGLKTPSLLIVSE